MRRFDQTGQDSLELLLDTLCNVFGGIILITCLLAMMARAKPKTEAGGAKESNKTMLVEMRLATAEEDLARLGKLEAKLAKLDDAELRMLAAEQQELEKTLERLREQKKDKPTPGTVTAPLDPGQEVSRLKGRAAQARAKLAEATSEEDAVKARSDEIKKRIAAIHAQIGESEDGRTQKLRFPKEGSHTKSPWFVMIKDGHFHPVWLPDGKLSDRVREEKAGADSQLISPIPGKGLQKSLDDGVLKAMLQAVKKRGAYVSVIVYQDEASFEAFRHLKELIINERLDYGFGMQVSDAPVSFSSTGTSAPPL